MEQRGLIIYCSLLALFVRPSSRHVFPTKTKYIFYTIILRVHAVNAFFVPGEKMGYPSMAMHFQRILSRIVGLLLFFFHNFPLHC